MILFLTILCVTTNYTQLNNSNSLPSKVTDYLNEHYYKWEIAKISDKAKRFSNDISNIIKGDFDDNGIQDLVIQITYQDTSKLTRCPNLRDTPLRERQASISFLFYNDSTKIEQLTRACWPIPDVILRKYDKGSIKEAEMGVKRIRFDRDSFSIYSITGTSEDLFIFQENKFKIIQYADI